MPEPGIQERNRPCSQTRRPHNRRACPTHARCPEISPRSLQHLSEDRPPRAKSYDRGARPKAGSLGPRGKFAEIVSGACWRSVALSISAAVGMRREDDGEVRVRRPGLGDWEIRVREEIDCR